MVLILTSRVLRDCDQWLGLLVQILGLLVHSDQLDIVVQSNDAAILDRLDVLFADETRLIIKESVRVSTPCHAPHIDPNRSKIKRVSC